MSYFLVFAAGLLVGGSTGFLIMGLLVALRRDRQTALEFGGNDRPEPDRPAWRDNFAEAPAGRLPSVSTRSAELYKIYRSDIQGRRAVMLFDPEPAPSVYAAILEHIARRGEPPESWRVGITSDPERCLFDEQGVAREDDSFIVRRCRTYQEARVVEVALLNCGCDGGDGEGDASGEFLYAYLSSPGNQHTDSDCIA